MVCSMDKTYKNCQSIYTSYNRKRKKSPQEVSTSIFYKYKYIKTCILIKESFQELTFFSSLFFVLLLFCCTLLSIFVFFSLHHQMNVKFTNTKSFLYMKILYYQIQQSDICVYQFIMVRIKFMEYKFLYKLKQVVF